MTTEDCNDLRIAKKIEDGETFERIVRWPTINGGTDYHPFELMAALTTHSNCVRSLVLSRMTDEAGLILAQFIATTETLEKLSFDGTNFSKNTYWCIAAAFRANTSIVDVRFTDTRSFLLNKEMHVVQAFNASFADNPHSPIQRLREDLFPHRMNLYGYYSVKKDSQQ